MNEQELDALNKIVTAYLDIVEVQAFNHEPMYMRDWLETIDDYLKLTRREILTTKGRISHKQAIDKRIYMIDGMKHLLLTGINGCGKTSVLKAIENSFLYVMGFMGQDWTDRKFTMDKSKAVEVIEIHKIKMLTEKMNVLFGQLLVYLYVEKLFAREKGDKDTVDDVEK